MKKTANRASTLRQRIRRFYDLCNHKQFARCFRMVDPTVRKDSTSVTLFQYEQSLQAFLAVVGEISIRKIDLQIHCDEPSVLYGNRDFAVGTTVWEDKDGTEHVSQERWVRQGRHWYTRATGMAAPAR